MDIIRTAYYIHGAELIKLPFLHASSVKQETSTTAWLRSCMTTYTGSMWQIESPINLVSSCIDVDMARLRSTMSTVARRSPMLLAGSVSGRPHSKWWWCLDIGYPLLAAEHSPCKARWSGTPCQTTSAHSRTMSPLDSTCKPGYSY